MTAPRLRLDLWLWYARFFRTRALAQEACEKGRVRGHGHRLDKGHMIKEGDVLTFIQGSKLRTVRILALGERRGAATAAAELYEDLFSSD
jgi:ribosome-associated heat shock protein Hsp15